MTVTELRDQLSRLIEAGHGDLDVVLVGSQWTDGASGHETAEGVDLVDASPLYSSDRMSTRVVVLTV